MVIIHYLQISLFLDFLWLVAKYHHRWTIYLLLISNLCWLMQFLEATFTWYFCFFLVFAEFPLTGNNCLKLLCWAHFEANLVASMVLGHSGFGGSASWGVRHSWCKNVSESSYMLLSEFFPGRYFHLQWLIRTRY